MSFSRNFGKEAGLFAGLENAKGDYVVAMDVDLQDPPSLLPEMFSYIDKGYDSWERVELIAMGHLLKAHYFETKEDANNYIQFYLTQRKIEGR